MSRGILGVALSKQRHRARGPAEAAVPTEPLKAEAGVSTTTVMKYCYYREDIVSLQTITAFKRISVIFHWVFRTVL